MEYLQCFPQWMASPPPIFLEKTAQHWTTKMSKFFQVSCFVTNRQNLSHTGKLQIFIYNILENSRLRIPSIQTAYRVSSPPSSTAILWSAANSTTCILVDGTTTSQRSWQNSSQWHRADSVARRRNSWIAVMSSSTQTGRRPQLAQRQLERLLNNLFILNRFNTPFFCLVWCPLSLISSISHRS